MFTKKLSRPVPDHKVYSYSIEDSKTGRSATRISVRQKGIGNLIPTGGPGLEVRVWALLYFQGRSGIKDAVTIIDFCCFCFPTEDDCLVHTNRLERDDSFSIPG
ncbi:hypothetical protein AVEN_146354-1 [Araneus ventricosus]|uniref:Uncharacterized protein n=1 Tax=Araneus ventricosus TaxID=182803 RepID=A0A4Y2VJZ5_ARAVE|nr:hypothetical protein AVEN_33239-1 [Araneus ventricosus]GBO25575.1 hypothetical protein AVEN_146354-1 [Araneus ventricosus]